MHGVGNSRSMDAGGFVGTNPPAEPITAGLPVILPRRITLRQASKDLSGAHVQMVHCQCANGEFLNASFQDSQTPDRHCTHRNRPDRRGTKGECTDRQCTHRSAARSDYVCSILRLHHKSLSSFDLCIASIITSSGWERQELRSRHLRPISAKMRQQVVSPRLHRYRTPCPNACE